MTINLFSISLGISRSCIWIETPRFDARLVLSVLRHGSN